jgi:hypothetical protein
VQSFGSAPFTIASGKYSHVPFAGANSAGYIQTDVGSRVTRIGADVTFPVGGDTESLALVLPMVAWTSGVYTPAGIHFVLLANGAWHVSYWDGSTESLYAPGWVVDGGSIADGITRRIEITIDIATSTAYFSLPFGRTMKVTDARIAANTSTFAVWELFEATGVGAHAATISALWADAPGTRAGTRSATQADVAKAVASIPAAIGVAATKTVMQYAPGTQLAEVVPNAGFADIDATNVKMTFTTGSTGKVMLTLAGYVAMTAVGQILWQIVDVGTGGSWMTETVIGPGQQFTGNMVANAYVALTPNTTYTIKWRHLSTVASVATFKASGPNGFYAIMAAENVT